MKIRKIFLMLGIILTSMCATTYAANFDFDAVTEKYFDYYMVENDYNNEYTYQLYSMIDENGVYSDIDYQGSVSSAWTHLDRLIQISVAANSSGSSVHEVREDAMAKVDAGIKHWYNTMGLPLDENGELKEQSQWWNHTIGQQLKVMPLLVIAVNDISEESKEILMKYLYSSEDMKNYPGFLTGANLIWYENEAIIEALIRRDYNMLKKSMDIITSTVKLVSNIGLEGLQSDGSFHQHGSNYYPSYAVNYVLHVATHLGMMEGTDLERKDLYPLLLTSVKDGFRWIFRGRYMNPNLAGREISDKPAKRLPDVDAYVKAARAVAKLCPEEATELNNFANDLHYNRDQRPGVVGNKYFYRSDIMCHNRDSYSFVNRMVSDRTVATECNGTQNIFGSYIGFSSSFLDKEDDNHYGFSAFMDWAKIPGTTTPAQVEKITYSGTTITQREKFVGGVSDGNYGATAMQMSAYQVSAKKSCFAFDDQIVFLGAGITSTRNDVNTSVEQRFTKGDLYINGVLTDELDGVVNDVSCVTENNISYVFPEKNDVHIKNGMVEGKWSDIGNSSDTAVYSEKCFSMWIPHGDNPYNDSYSYIVLPDCDSASAQSFAENMPISIISNTEKLQAVYNSEAEVGYAVFYEAGKCSFNNKLQVRVTKPCILMLVKTSNGIEISVANPLQTTEKIDVTLTNSGFISKRTFDLQGNIFNKSTLGGSTVSKVY